MTVIGIDDTDSRDRGMCTTYVATRLASTLRERGLAARSLLIRLNPAVEYKTRGNAALAVHTDADPELALALATELIGDTAEMSDPRTDPGLVVAPGQPATVPPAVASFARAAVRDHLTVAAARRLLARVGYRHETWQAGRGLIGALAAVGARRALPEWTYEHIAYREPHRWETPRTVDRASVFSAADRAYPTVWDTVDTEEKTAVCVPHTPCPVLYGIRGDEREAVRRVAGWIESEPVAASETFLTNQGTDAHLRDANLAEVRTGRSYRIRASVVNPPETRAGGHVFFRVGDGTETLRCVAFEPTKRFRDHVRSLRAGDGVTVCGEVSDGTLKLEKFAVRSLVRTEAVVPTCPGCDRSMESAGRTAGYRCRDCGTDAPGRVHQRCERTLELGWYEVPPCARRHAAKPLVRGGFDAPVHPAR